jgi:hypothetical protein
VTSLQQSGDARVTNVGQPGTAVRLANALIALAFASLALAAYWPMTKLVDLQRADLGIRGEWIGGHAKQITKLTPGGVADLAGLRVGDVLEFDPREPDCWILAGYRDVPEGFAAQVQVHRANGSRTLLMFKPNRVPFLPGLDDVMATAAQLTTASVVILLGVVLIWARPGLMTWSLFMAYFAAFPYFPWTAYVLAFETGRSLEFWSIVASLFLSCLVMVVPFTLCFPRNFLHDWPAWKQVAGAMLCMAVIACVAANLRVVPFEQDPSSFEPWRIALVPGVFVPVLLFASLALARTYRDADGRTRARLRWVLLGMIAPMVSIGIAITIGMVPYLVSGTMSGHMLTAPGWVFALGAGILFPIAVGIAVLRERVVDIQFAVSRTVVYGAVSSLVLVILAALHWLLGKLIEQTHLTIGIEAFAAVGLGLVLHRATEAINRLVDRVLFRRRHAAEKHLQRVMAALPFASGLRVIGEALVTEPARELDLVSAAVFYRQAETGPLQRLTSEGWSEEHAASLDADCLLVRRLQAEHAPVRVEQRDLPADVPQGAALPVLAVPVASQRALRAVVLYGSHRDSTLPDPDDVTLLHRIAKAAEASHQQVQIATLMRDSEVKQVRIAQLKASLAELRALVPQSAVTRAAVDAGPDSTG